MKRLTNEHTLSNVCARHYQLPTLAYSKTLSAKTWCEHTILAMQEKFLTNGFQHITVSDGAAGRELVMTFVNSLHCYHNVAALTLEQEPLPQNMTDLYVQLVQNNCLAATRAENAMEEFLLDTFYYDLLWIEATPKLLEQSWFVEFEHEISSLQLDEKLPIVMISYDESIA